MSESDFEKCLAIVLQATKDGWHIDWLDHTIVLSLPVSPA